MSNFKNILIVFAITLFIASGIYLGKRLIEYYYPMERKNINYEVWSLSKDVLKKSVQEILFYEKDIQYYVPYRGKGQQSILRVIYKDSLFFDLEGNYLTPINDLSIKRLSNYLKNENNTSIKSLTESIITKVRQLENKKIYSITRTDSTTRVITSYFDSSYESLKLKYPNYKENHYESEYSEGSKGREFVITFLFLNGKVSEKYIAAVNEIHYLWMLDSSCYYYRTYVPVNI